MARRPVFTPLGTRPHVHEVSAEFTLHPGFSLKQEQRSIDSLHRSFLSAHPGARMLEVSGGSPLVLGAELSVFRLEPRTFFYDWLYVSALAGRPELVNELEHRAAFTDIEFNPKRSINCQAHSVALFQGIVGGWRRDSLRPPDHPRSRGVYYALTPRNPTQPGSSPLARGLRRGPAASLVEPRIIPARAGFTTCIRTRRRTGSDHPRSRGVYCGWWPARTRRAGSSPLARGLLWDAAADAEHRRIIPARAGFTRAPTTTAPGGRDHPRSRGVYIAALVAGLIWFGSSPLARGLQGGGGPDDVKLGIIPARAGFTRRAAATGPGGADHPRSRGVYRGHTPRRIRPYGIIPARAGFTRRPGLVRGRAGDHPRSRGVYGRSSIFRTAATGSSPLARGLLAQRYSRDGEVRIIPARAGFTPG